MVQEAQKIERSIRERRDTDVPLVNYWIYVLVLSWLTLGIFPIIVYFQRIIRIDKFIQRRRDYYPSVTGYTTSYAKETGQYDSVSTQLQDMKRRYDEEFEGSIKEINAPLAFLLSLVTFGIWGVYVLYRMNRVWDDLQRFEEGFDLELSAVWSKVGLSRYPIQFQRDPKKTRSFALYLILSIVTFGIWGIVWDYQIHTDPDRLYTEFHSAEDMVLQVVRQSSESIAKSV